MVAALRSAALAAAIGLVVGACGPGLTGPCPGGPLFTSYPTEQSRLEYIVPLGDLDPPDHTIPAQHMYWNLTSPGSKASPLLAPGPLTVTAITRTDYDSRSYDRDYSIEFTVCYSVVGYFNHVSELSAPLDRAASGEYEKCSTRSTGTESVTECRAELSESFAAGDVLGVIGDVASTQGVDFGLTDSRVTHSFINGERMNYLRHQVAAYEYYTPQLQSGIRGIIGTFDGSRRTAEPLGGEVAYDRAGTAQGVWFKVGGSGFFESYAVALVEETVFPEVLAFSIAEIGSNHDSSVLHFSPASSGPVNPPFDSVDASRGIVCYENLFTDRTLSSAAPDAIVLLRYRSDGTLLIETGADPAGCGAGPWSFSGSEIALER